ncbi:hypothetical protein PABG_00398 [Paracoccidioides brasiliensis Pb03]|nr:hypothetical protein PABG_00398 [Paracoccidioides brasiliensis Pb03]
MSPSSFFEPRKSKICISAQLNRAKAGYPVKPGSFAIGLFPTISALRYPEFVVIRPAQRGSIAALPKYTLGNDSKVAFANRNISDLQLLIDLAPKHKSGVGVRVSVLL